MVALSETLTIKAKWINSKWSNAGMQGLPPTDNETHLVLVTCFNWHSLETKFTKTSKW